MKNVVFLHPDLGIGGAERLIVDAAVGLQNYRSSHQYNVYMYTQHHDHTHCFRETLPVSMGGSLVNNVRVYGDWMPRNVPLLRSFHILFAILRMIYSAICVALWHCDGPIDVIIVDQISACIPILRWMPRTRDATILFYCHFPDKALSLGRHSIWKRLYRVPFDWIEERTTAMADVVMVNSNFTKSIYRTSFPHIRRLKKSHVSDPIVLYPPIHCENYDRKPEDTDAMNEQIARLYADPNLKIVVSVNRFERKKGIDLAVKSFAKLRHLMKDFSPMRFIVAGGYDPRLDENVEYMEELKDIVNREGLKEQTLFLPNFTDADRYMLLHKSTILLYTPENEHFGIVPVEAQYCRCNVIAVNSGGPLESIEHGRSGLLAEPTPEAFSQAMHTLLTQTTEERQAMGQYAHERVLQLFSLETFVRQLDTIISQQ